MICVAGAGGTVSSELIKQLESANAPFRAAHFSNEKAEAARARGIDAVIIDYNRPEMLRAAFQGCDKLFLLGPNVLNPTQFELNAVEAAQAVGVVGETIEETQNIYIELKDAKVKIDCHRRSS